MDTRLLRTTTTAPRVASSWHEADDIEAETIKPLEIWWRDRYRYLKSKGYTLRHHLQPGWTPSWMCNSDVKDRDSGRCEDYPWEAVVFSMEDMIDARDRNGRLVNIKKMPGDSSELALLLELSKDADNTKNHCILILDSFLDSEDPSLTLTVMPCLLPLDEPAFFHSIDEVMDLGEQMLEGLNFLHSRGISNVISEVQTIKMDPQDMFPESFHGIRTWRLPDCSGAACPRSRTGAGGKYYLSHLRQRVTDDHNTTPESNGACKMQDMGRFEIMLSRFRTQFPCLDFYQSFEATLCHPDPSARPTAQTALERWRRIRKDMYSWRSFAGMYRWVFPDFSDLIIDTADLRRPFAQTP